MPAVERLRTHETRSGRTMLRVLMRLIVGKGEISSSFATVISSRQTATAIILRSPSYREDTHAEPTEITCRVTCCLGASAR